MKERPILFSAPMVRALLDGSKTQTRRVAKEFAGRDDLDAILKRFPHQDGCPYGHTGDRLWVRETWGVVSNEWDADGNLVGWAPDRPATAVNEMRFGQGYYSGHVIYAADGSYEWAGDDDGGGEPRSAWHPSIHMPRAASRILIEVVSVRVERLQDISEADAIAEGLPWQQCTDWMGPNGSQRDFGPKDAYRELWEQINGAGSWDANPWVWVVEFKRVAP